METLKKLGIVNMELTPGCRILSIDRKGYGTILDNAVEGGLHYVYIRWEDRDKEYDNIAITYSIKELEHKEVFTNLGHPVYIGDVMKFLDKKQEYMDTVLYDIINAWGEYSSLVAAWGYYSLPFHKLPEENQRKIEKILENL